ncbi:hypothetical protein JCM13580A_38490 [Streptomyces drozdowiczii]
MAPAYNGQVPLGFHHMDGVRAYTQQLCCLCSRQLLIRLVHAPATTPTTKEPLLRTEVRSSKWIINQRGDMGALVNHSAPGARARESTTLPDRPSAAPLTRLLRSWSTQKILNDLQIGTATGVRAHAE